MQVFKNNVSLEATPTGDTHIVNKAYLEDRISKINIQHAIKVDELPTCVDNGDGTYTISYVKDGTTKTTTDTSQWFYYLDDNGNLKQTIFLEGEELTIDGASVDFDDFVAKTDIATTLDDAVTDEQVVSALTIYNAIKDWNSAYNLGYVNSTSLNVNLAKAGLYKFSTITEGAPSDNPGDYTLLNIPWGKNQDVLKYGMQLLFSPRVQHFYFRRVWNYSPTTYVYTEGDYSVFGKWNVCGQSNAYTLGYEPSLITQIPENEDLNNYTNAGVYICKSYTISATLSNAPNKTKNHAFKLEVNCTANGICQQRILALNNSTDVFEFSRTYSTTRTWSAWKKVCYTSIEDVEVTSLVPANTTNYRNADTTSAIQSSHYCVKNGICTINIGLSCTTPSTSFITLFSGLPKPKAKYTFRAFAHDSTNGITQVNINIIPSGEFLINGGKAGIVWYTASISYPVADNWRP